jgi:hypothetical protein
VGLTINQGMVGVTTGDANLGSATNVVTLNGGGIAAGFNTLGALAQWTVPRLASLTSGPMAVSSRSSRPQPTLRQQDPAHHDNLIGSSNITKIGGGTLR